VVAEKVVAADGYGIVEARDRFTGKRLWRSDALVRDEGMLASLNFVDRRDPSFVAGGVGVGAGRVLLGTTEGEVVAFNAADGNVIWTAELGSEILCVPTVDDGLVFAQTIDGRLVALDADDGTVAWTYDNQVPILTLRGTSSPVVRDDIVYAGFANGKVIALRAENGEPIWEHRVMLPEGRSELERMVDVDSSPLISGAQVYVAAYQGRVKGLSRTDGRPLWEQEISSFLDLSEGYGQVYVVDDEDIITAIDQQSGEAVWTQESFRRRKLTSPLAFSNYVVFGDEEGYLHVIAQRDGRLLGRRKLDGDGIRSGIVIEDTTFYVFGNSGSLHALTIDLK
jgi:outer membrane protein assembly factor BamB